MKHKPKGLLAAALALCALAAGGPLELTAAAVDYTNGEGQEPVLTFTDPEQMAQTADGVAPTGANLSGEDVEIERKWLVDTADLPSNMERIAYRFDFVQTYICFSPEMRVRAFDGRYYFTLKRPLDEVGLARQEIQFQITRAEYEDLLTKQVGSTIYKTRYQFQVGDTWVYVDVYTGSLAGLVVAEVEFDSVEAAEAFVPPAWFGLDVTGDKRYKNASLARDGMPAEPR